jgi:hypothetical protein
MHFLQERVRIIPLSLLLSYGGAGQSWKKEKITCLKIEREELKLSRFSEGIISLLRNQQK